jgi:hypothetical protein
MEEPRTIINHAPMSRWGKFLPGALGVFLMVLLFISVPGLVYSTSPTWVVMSVYMSIILISATFIALTIVWTLRLTPSKVVLFDDRVEFHTRERGTISVKWNDLKGIRTSVKDNSLFSSGPKLGYSIHVMVDEGSSTLMDVSREIALAILTSVYGSGIPDTYPNLKLVGLSRKIPGRAEGQRTYWLMLALLTALVILPSLLIMSIINNYVGLLIVMIIPFAMAIRLLGMRRHSARGRRDIDVDGEGMNIYLTHRDRRDGVASPIRFQDIQRIYVLWEVNAYTTTEAAAFRDRYAILVLRDGKELSLGARDGEAISFLAAAVEFAHSASNSI